MGDTHTPHTHAHAHTQTVLICKHRTAYWEVSPAAPGLGLGWPTWCTLCCSKLRHSPRQLRVAAEVAFRSSRSWSKAVRGPEPGRDSMACTRFFCCPSTWFIIYKMGRQQGGKGQKLSLPQDWKPTLKPWAWRNVRGKW